MRQEPIGARSIFSRFYSCFGWVILFFVILLILFGVWLHRFRERGNAPIFDQPNFTNEATNLGTSNADVKIDQDNGNNDDNNSFTIPSGNYNYTLSLDGSNRSYAVHVPKKYDVKAAMPLVFILHGAGSSGEGVRKDTMMDNKAEAAGFIVVYPDGSPVNKIGRLRGVWNAGNCFKNESNDADDVAFIRQVISQVSSQFNINQKRIYVAGFSNGAMMAHRLACELDDKLAAVAAVSGGLSLNYSDCQPAKPIPLLHIHGLADPVVKFTGGGINISIAGCNRQPIPEVMDFWRQENKCSDKTENIYQKGVASCSRYLACQNDNEIALCTISNGGHTWPKLADFSATNYIWDEFFSKIIK